MPLDEDIVAAMYVEHGPALRRFARRWVSSDADAEDIVQEAMLRVWRNAPASATPLRAYLFRTVHNLVIDSHRRSERRPKTVGGVEQEAHAEPVRAGDDATLDRMILEEALMQLSAKHCEAIVLVHYERMTVAAAAAALGVPEGTIKSRCHQGLRRLRAVLDSWEVAR